MALQATIETNFGIEMPVYIRVNNVEASNHGVTSVALFRGFASKEAFEQRKAFVWEWSMVFTPDVSLPLWEQAYSALKDHDPAAEAQTEMDDLEKNIERAVAALTKAQTDLAEAALNKLPDDIISEHQRNVLQASHGLEGYESQRPELEAKLATAVKLRDALQAAKDV